MVLLPVRVIVVLLTSFARMLMLSLGSCTSETKSHSSTPMSGPIGSSTRMFAAAHTAKVDRRYKTAPGQLMACAVLTVEVSECVGQVRVVWGRLQYHEGPQHLVKDAESTRVVRISANPSVNSSTV
jgi:hypothetical protein